MRKTVSAFLFLFAVQIFAFTEELQEPSLIEPETSTDVRANADEATDATSVVTPVDAAIDATSVVTPVDATIDATENNNKSEGLQFILTMEVPDNNLINKFLKQYDSPEGKKWLQGVINRGSPYIPYILKKINEMGLPTELVFLPVIESSFMITARSKSNALGMWQFMTNSIAPFGIRRNEWIDERLDPWKTTDAALKKLQENYNALGSWEMALAAYNCGLGAATRATKKYNTSDFWTLANSKQLPSETILYVPKFLAISQILTNKENSIIIDLEKAIEETEIITTKKGIDVKILAKEVGLAETKLKELNPALLYNITPPGISYDLRVPVESKEKIQKTIDSNKILISYSQYTICSGDTLYALSQHYGVSIDMIMQYNPGVKPSALRLGQKLIIPALKQVSPYKRQIAEQTGDFSETYIVKKGDTLWSISLAYGVQVETLAEKNNLKINQVLSTGKTLKVPKIE